MVGDELLVISPSNILVGGWTNPFEKYARQIGSSPQVGVKIKNIWNHHLVLHFMTDSEENSISSTSTTNQPLVESAFDRL